MVILQIQKMVGFVRIVENFRRLCITRLYNTFKKLNLIQLSEKEQQTLDKFVSFIMDNDVSDTFLVQIIEVAGGFADIESIQSRAKRTGLSYNGIKKTRKLETILGQRFVVGKE